MAYLGQDIKKLGFGLMRLPRKDGDFDIPQIEEMVDLFLGAGFTYFDTAYVYDGGGSEKAIKEALVDRYPRDKFRLATKLKLPMDGVTRENVDMEFETSLERTGAGYFDFYLLHCLLRGNVDDYDDLGAWEFVSKKKAEGKIKHIGFSFHDSPEVLEQILVKHPEAEFVQLQINYIDWEDKEVQARANYEVCKKYGKPVIIMEPVKGGSLATLRDEVRSIFNTANPDVSPASWAVRFAASLDNVITVLSGMSTVDQMKDNLKTMSDFKPLTAEEYKVIDRAVDVIKSVDLIPCTKCRYCMNVCPMGVDTPGVFEVLNDYRTYQNLPGAKRSYGFLAADKRADKCVECGACEDTCPQHIGIRELLKEADALLNN